MNREQREQYEQGGLQGTLLFTEGLFFLNGSRFPPWRGGETSPWTLPRTALNLQGTLPFLFAYFAPFAVRIYNGYSFYFSAGQGNSNVTFLKIYSRKLDSYSLNMYIHMIALAGWIGLP